MTHSTLDSILEELGEILKINLKADRWNCCLIKCRDGVEVQIELDSNETHLLIGTTIGTLLPGRYRQDFLEQALKSNGLHPPSLGSFAFVKKDQIIVLFKKFSLKEVTGQQIADFLPPFREKAKLWKQFLLNNEIPFLDLEEGNKKTVGMFGL